VAPGPGELIDDPTIEASEKQLKLESLNANIKQYLLKVKLQKKLDHMSSTDFKLLHEYYGLISKHYKTFLQHANYENELVKQALKELESDLVITQVFMCIIPVLNSGES